MLLLTCSAKLTALRNLLRHGFPESLKVHGAIHHVMCNNPFRLQVLVDQWPDFTSVICRPPLEEMTDDLDVYTNTYFLFSKDPQNLSQMLEDPKTVNWKQKLQIQGCQPQLGNVLHKISSRYGGRMERTSNVLYRKEGATSTREEDDGRHRRTISLHFSALDPDEAVHVNAQWGFGRNERSERYIRRCIQMFPTMSARSEAGRPPIAWVLSEQSAEVRMGYTEDAYRSQGVFHDVVTRLASIMASRGVPLYCHIAADNTKSQTACRAAGFSPLGHWEQWSFKPS
ncbi:glycine N-acyltransferase-like protein 2 [Hyla sarda]|uniref:glycine N-acyltransferase-like protein 2 n=1 Tax=Hyla sarda TaxID=327740 RepID=UPI0024C2BFB4|nr:glycine N-acyltransferase-like protein 2 [Hyla sarda]